MSEENKEIDTPSSDAMTSAIDRAKPILAKLSFGSVMGYCSGIAVKKFGKVAATAIGAVFIGLQTCASYGYLSINWGKFKEDAIKKVDTNGDGNFDADDMKVYWRKLKALLTKNMPNNTGFSLGFLYGIKQG